MALHNHPTPTKPAKVIKVTRAGAAQKKMGKG